MGFIGNITFDGEKSKLMVDLKPLALDLGLTLFIIFLIIGTAEKLSIVPDQPYTTHRHIEVTVVIPKVPAQAAKLIKINDHQHPDNNIWVENIAVKPCQTTGNYDSKHTALHDLHVTLTGQSTISNASINFGGQRVGIGRSYEITANDYSFTGTVSDIIIH